MFPGICDGACRGHHQCSEAASDRPLRSPPSRKLSLDKQLIRIFALITQLLCRVKAADIPLTSSVYQPINRDTEKPDIFRGMKRLPRPGVEIEAALSLRE